VNLDKKILEGENGVVHVKARGPLALLGLNWVVSVELLEV
jgi:hypothetical protein